MKLRFVMAWQTYRVGDVITPPAMLRDRLLAMRWNGRPFVERVEEPPPPARPAPSTFTPPPPEAVLAPAAAAPSTEPIAAAPVYTGRRSKRH